MKLIGGEDYVLEVKLGGQTDYLMLFPESKKYQDKERGIEMLGKVGMVRSGPRSNAIAILDGSWIDFKGRKVTSQRRAYRQRADVGVGQLDV